MSYEVRIRRDDERSSDFAWGIFVDIYRAGALVYEFTAVVRGDDGAVPRVGMRDIDAETFDQWSPLVERMARSYWGLMPDEDDAVSKPTGEAAARDDDNETDNETDPDGDTGMWTDRWGGVW